MKARTILRSRVVPLLALFTLSAFGLLVASAAFAQQGDPQKKDEQKKGGKGKGKGGGAAASTNGVLVKDTAQFKQVFREPIAKVIPSIVRVLCDGKDTALGVAVSADGFILTKASDLQGKITVKLRDGDIKEGKILGVHEPHDLAMLKIDAAGLVPVEFKDSKIVEVGHWVITPGMSVDPAAIGVVSVATRPIPKATKGAPKKDPKKGGKKEGKKEAESGGYLGVNLDDAVKMGGKTGAWITNVAPNTPAAKAGIQEKDIVLSVSGKGIVDAEALIRAIASYKPGDTITLQILRGTDDLELKATLDKWAIGPPAKSRSDTQNNMGSRLSKRKTGFPVILQHDAVVLPEDCGGPLVDLQGNVIGINICRWGRVESYAVPSEEIRPILNDLISGKRFPLVTPKGGK